MAYGNPQARSRARSRWGAGQSRGRAEGARERRPRVLVAATHDAIRRGFKLALEPAGFMVAAESSTARAAVETASRIRPDVCLIDLDLPGEISTAIGQIADRVPTARIVLLADSTEEADSLAALRAGAVGLLPKDIEHRRLPVALRAILAGEAAVPRRQVYRLIEELRRQQSRGETVIASGKEVHLTRRELDVLEHLAEARSTAEIAGTLGTSTGTVRSHIHALRRKLGEDPRAAAAAILEREPLRDPTPADDLEARRRRIVQERRRNATTGR